MEVIIGNNTAIITIVRRNNDSDIDVIMVFLIRNNEVVKK